MGAAEACIFSGNKFKQNPHHQSPEQRGKRVADKAELSLGEGSWADVTRSAPEQRLPAGPWQAPGVSAEQNLFYKRGFHNLRGHVQATG